MARLETYYRFLRVTSRRNPSLSGQELFLHMDSDDGAVQRTMIDALRMLVPGNRMHVELVTSYLISGVRRWGYNVLLLELVQGDT